MKLALRVLALSVAFACIAAASVSSVATKAKPSRQSATQSLPIPGCVPGLPTCPASTAGK
jgi:hypothetical protein